MGLVELMVASMVLFVGLFALMAGMAATTKYVGFARQRQAATAAAQNWMEQIRGMGYERVAHATVPAPSGDPDDPVAALSADGQLFNVAGNGVSCTTAIRGVCEVVVVSGSDGGLESYRTALVGSASVEMWSFVTWVEDENELFVGDTNYKRVTLVSRLLRPQAGSLSEEIRVETFIGAGTVQLPTSSPTEDSAPSPVPTASPEPAFVLPECPNDTSPPTGTLAINPSTGPSTGFVNTTAVIVSLTVHDDCESVGGELSSDGISWGGRTVLTPDTPTPISWTLSAGDGTKVVWARFFDGNARMSELVSASIVLDTVAQPPPTGLRATCTIVQNTRTTVLAWDLPSGSDSVGFRVYRTDGSGSTGVVGTVPAPGLTFSDVSSKSEAVSYTVRAFDQAGNESGDSNVVSFARNSC